MRLPSVAQAWCQYSMHRHVFCVETHFKWFSPRNSCIRTCIQSNVHLVYQEVLSTVSQHLLIWHFCMESGANRYEIIGDKVLRGINSIRNQDKIPTHWRLVGVGDVYYFVCSLALVINMTENMKSTKLVEIYIFDMNYICVTTSSL